MAGALTLAVVAALVASPNAVAQQDGSRQPLHRFELVNGLEIMVLENHAAPIATILLAVRSGANAQQPGEEGMAHLFEHLVFHSYGSGPGAVWAAVADLGGSLNGGTGVESVSYLLLVPSQNTERGIRLMARLVTDADFGAGDLQDERSVVLDELEREQADPEHALERRVRQRFWGAVWHRRDVGGDSASLQRITADRIREAYAQYYVPNNAVMIVTGDVLADEVLHSARRYFGEWQRGADPFGGGRHAPIEKLTASRWLIVAHPVPDVTIRIAMQGPGLGTDSTASYAAAALFEMINDPRSAFQRRLVESGLFQLVYASYYTMQDVGPITILAKTTDGAVQDALRVLLSEIDSLEVLPGITEAELGIASRRREVAAAVAEENAVDIAQHLARWWAGTGMDHYRTYHDRINQLTLDDLRRFAHRYLVQQPKIIGVLGSESTMSRLADWLRGSPSEP